MNYLYYSNFLLWILIAFSAVIWPRILISSLFSTIIAVGVLGYSYFLINIEKSPFGHWLEQGDNKYRKLYIPLSEIEKMGAIIEEYLVKQEVFLDPDLKLIDVANHIKMNKEKTSQVINRYFKKSFSELLTSLRIEKTVLMLKSPDKNDFNILNIAFDCGFNSKSVFNESF